MSLYTIKALLNLISYSYRTNKYSNIFRYTTLLLNRPKKLKNDIGEFSRLKHNLQSRWPFLLMWTLPFTTSSDNNTNAVLYLPQENTKLRDEIKKVILESDKLFECSKFQEAARLLLPYKESENVEILWRLSRALYNQAQSSVVSKEEKKQLIYDAFFAISEALELDNTHWAVHKWMSILLDAHSAYDGIKARVTQLERVKNHMLRAVELNPYDATTFYMLGSWCYQIADMPWFQRKIAATIFAEPPTSTYEEALQFFSKAEEIDPKFYSQNLLMLGKTLLKLERSEEAVYYLSLARDYPSSTEEDYLVQKEAMELLKNVKPTEN